MTNYTIYRLFDFETGLYVGPEFSSIRDFFTHHIKHTFYEKFPDSTRDWGIMEFLDPSYRRVFREMMHIGYYNHPTKRRGIFQGRYAIRDAYDRNYPHPDELYRLAHPVKRYRYRWYDYGWTEPLIHLPKNNKNKLKSETWSWFYRGVRTSNEIRQNNAHVNEHGQNMVRAKRRGFNIPSSWDDKPNSRWDTRKNWKHNSKRRHQWKHK